MILWLTGQTQSGKTTLARKLASGSKNTVVLDGDELREVWPGLKLSKEDRWEQNLRVARLAKLLESQGLTIIVSVIAPFEDLRREIETICGCKFIHLDNNNFTYDCNKPYEKPHNPIIKIRR